MAQATPAGYHRPRRLSDEGMAEHTFIFADLAGFTALTEAHGDDEAADLAGEFCGEVRKMLDEYNASEIKTIGDALMIRTSDPAAAVRLGRRIVEEVGRQHGFPAIRIGMHSGAAVERSGDWFGAAVNLAARVSGAAAGGEVLLTAATRERAGEIDGVELRERGRRAMKNVAEPVLLFAAVGEGERDATGLAVDPVCRMGVEPAHGVGYLRFDDSEYHFCSLGCAQAFAAAPERYARPAA